MKFTIDMNKLMSLTLAMVAAYAAMLLPADALAQVTIGIGGGAAGASGGGPIADVLCRVVNWFQGPIGAGIATLAIIVVGIGALMGKVSWGMAIIVGLGVGVIFGAPTIVNMLGGNGSC